MCFLSKLFSKRYVLQYVEEQVSKYQMLFALGPIYND